jgi:hypothetical protein
VILRIGQNIVVETLAKIDSALTVVAATQLNMAMNWQKV